MKNITKLGLTALACLVLSACGSDSTGNSVNSLATVGNDGRTGSAIIISGEDERAIGTRKAITSADNFKQVIVIDGKSISIGSGDSDGYNDVRFGAIGSIDKSESDYIFYNGNVTEAIPARGTATYNGHFIVAGDTEQFEDEDYLTGTATFKVDFANKTLSGTLSEPTLQVINVDAQIQGNGFSGSAKSATFSTAADLEGKFYGKNAKELGGAFFDSQKTWGGAFGASQ